MQEINFLEINSKNSNSKINTKSYNNSFVTISNKEENFRVKINIKLFLFNENIAINRNIKSQ